MSGVLRDRLAALARFLPIFEAENFVAGKEAYLERIGDGRYTMRGGGWSNETAAFVQTAYDSGWVLPDFNWRAWQATVEAGRFLVTDWNDVVDAWQVSTWEGYAGVARLGRKTRLGCKQRETLWPVFESVRTGLADRQMVTSADVFGRSGGADGCRRLDQEPDRLRLCCARDRLAGARRRR